MPVKPSVRSPLPLVVEEAPLVWPLVSAALQVQSCRQWSTVQAHMIELIEDEWRRRVVEDVERYLKAGPRLLGDSNSR